MGREPPLKAAVKALSSLEKKSRKDIGSVFAKFANKDGRIVRDRLTPAFNQLGFLVNASEVNRFAVKDLDFEGFLSYLGMAALPAPASIASA